jgi:uncharacterized alkaline shock family protein YloU
LPLKEEMDMIGFETSLGTVEISQEYFANLIGHAASECYGVAGMLNSPYQTVRSRLLRRDNTDKGVRVRSEDGKLLVDIHIAVTYGVNISAIVKSIVHKVRYTVEESTGFPVAKVNVFVDSMKAQ